MPDHAVSNEGGTSTRLSHTKAIMTVARERTVNWWFGRVRGRVLGVGNGIRLCG